jgi:hypothetical protein
MVVVFDDDLVDDDDDLVDDDDSLIFKQHTCNLQVFLNENSCKI